MIAAIVLCGGESRRMGRPKAWLPFGPEALLQRVVRLAASAASPVVVVAAPGQDLPSLPGDVEVVRDPIAHRGPLQGLASGMEALPERSEFVYATATDAPFLAPAWVDRLASLIGDSDLAIPFIDGHHHPLVALYRRSPALPAIRDLLDSGRFRLSSLLDSLPARIVSADEMAPVDPGLGTLRNLNTPEEYAEALRLAGLAGGDFSNSTPSLASPESRGGVVDADRV